MNLVKHLCRLSTTLCLITMLAGCSSSSKMTPGPAATSSTVLLSGTSYDFGGDLVNNPVSKAVVQIINGGPLALTLRPSLSAASGFRLVPAGSCTAQLPAHASCSIMVSYDPANPSQRAATLNLNLGNAAAGTPSTVRLTGTPVMMSPGTVSATANPQVAQYTITPPSAGTVTVSFGKTTAYGQQTWTVPTPIGGGPVSIYVAGMLANTLYHMQATVALQNGTTVSDIDHTFTTTSYPATEIQAFAASTASGQVPQAGIEMVNTILAPAAEIAATDLSGKVLWQYVPAESLTGASIYAPKQMSNGDYLVVIGPAGSTILANPPKPGVLNLVREIDLTGKTVKQITMAEINARLAAANYNIVLQAFHHDATPLPNGHWLVLANTYRDFTNLPGFPGTLAVLGDVIVDLDTNLKPVWVWNEFDHLDVNRHPATKHFPDWTHTNAIIYSKDDGNILVSIRHQSWIVKVDYNNGAGTGNILWRLGEGGDFKLVGGTDPTDWFYGQHGPSFTTPNTTGIFGLTVFDNGNFRLFPPGVICGTAGAPPCKYSTVPVFQIDEAAKTATFQFHQILPPNLYAFFGGNSEVLANGDVEYDTCGLPGKPHSQVFEVTEQNNPQQVWTTQVSSNFAYRAYRLPSLYPGVQW